MSLWAKVRGSIESVFQIGLGGPALKNASGAIEHRNAADSAYAVARAANPVANNDLVTEMENLLNAEPTVETGATDAAYTLQLTGLNVTKETWKRNDATNIKTIDYTYTGTNVTQEVRKVFAADGTTVVAQVTWTYVYTGATFTSGSMTRDV